MVKEIAANFQSRVEGQDGELAVLQDPVPFVLFNAYIYLERKALFLKDHSQLEHDSKLSLHNVPLSFMFSCQPEIHNDNEKQGFSSFEPQQVHKRISTSVTSSLRSQF